MDNQIETSLLIGSPVSINDKFSFAPPLMDEIFKITFNELLTTVSIFYDLNYFLYKHSEINKIIEDNNFLSYDTWQLIILLGIESKNDLFITYFTNCLKWHLREVVVIKDDGVVFVGEKEFDKSDYEQLCKVLKITYGLDERIEERKFDGVKARRKAIEMRINRGEINQIESKTNSFLYQVVSVLKTRKSDDEIHKSNLFQLIDLYKRINKEKDYDSLMTGVYTGNVDAKKIDINTKHWTSSLK